MDAKDREIAQLRAALSGMTDLARFLTSQIPPEVMHTREYGVGFASTLKLMNSYTDGLPKLEPEALPPGIRALLSAAEELRIQLEKKT